MIRKAGNSMKHYHVRCDNRNNGLHLTYSYNTMQWVVKLGRIAVFASDNYEIASDYIIQYQADADADRKAGDNT